LLRGVGFVAENAKKTACVHGHEYTPENTIWRTGGRRCRICQLAAVAKYRSEHIESSRARSLAWYYRKKEQAWLSQ